MLEGREQNKMYLNFTLPDLLFDAAAAAKMLAYKKDDCCKRDCALSCTFLQVTELTSRSALLQWSPPERFIEAATSEGKSSEFDFSEADLRYEVLLSDKGKEGKYKSIYSGISLSCRYEIC
jgi:hypothetical protein